MNSENKYNLPEKSKKAELEVLYDKAELIKKVYYKGFISSLQGMFGDCENYVNKTKNRDEIEPHLKNILQDIKLHFNKIDDSELMEIMPELIKVKELILASEQIIINLLLKNPESERISELHKIFGDIIEISERFKSYIENIISKIRKLSGDEKFNIFVIDYKNDIFRLKYDF